MVFFIILCCLDVEKRQLRLKFLSVAEESEEYAFGVSSLHI